MITEYILTKYLRHYNSKNLIFNTHSNIVPPEPSKDKKPLLYIHIPFCEELCPYCSFNRFKFDKNCAKKYFTSLKKEILLYKKAGFDFFSAYIGGGTPTISIQELSEIIHLIKDNFSIKEVSCETNPNHLTEDKIKILSECKINRLSVGVQSFDNELLKKMDRFHKYGSSEDIQARLGDTLGVFPTLNIDMIFNFPTQSKAHVIKDCNILKKLKVDQVTFYPLMASTSTEKTIKKRFGKISYLHEKELYTEISGQIKDEYTPGTAWCFSRTKSMIDEYIIDYDEYIGVGSGSFGYYNGRILSNTFDLNEYNALVSNGNFSLKAEKNFSILEQMRYDFLIKLFGITMKKDFIREKYGDSFYKKLFKEFLFFKLNGAIKENIDNFQLTQKGQYYWVIMMREFFIGVNNFRDYCRKLAGAVI